MRRRTGLTRLVLLLALPIALGGCGRDGSAPDPAAALTNEPFFMRGVITETGQPWGYRVKGEPGTSYRVTDVFFSVQPGTLIQRSDGSSATTADLVVGRSITLWITGAIAESLPPQVGARLIVIR